MAILTTAFLVFLFIFGVISTLFQIPTKKVATLFGFESSSSNQDSRDQDLSKKRITEEPKKVMNKKGSVSVGCESRERKAELKSVFATFDKNRDGFITKQELSDSLKNIGISTSEKDVGEDEEGRKIGGGDGNFDHEDGKKLEDCKMMISKVDIDGDGMINFHEFKNMMKNGVSLISVS
ncbi:putative EF-hand domain pair protein CML [Helianthus annuus]|nr:putative EF-hand domain pair protein CML [Helianthus annuus]